MQHVCVALLLNATLSFAQTYPLKPIRIVAPYSAGGGVDPTGRAIAQSAFKAKLLTQGSIATSGMPERLAADIRADHERPAKLVKATGIEINQSPSGGADASDAEFADTFRNRRS
jgi:tripartite-type tricarboxylate transporter receptor subunit TctC